MDKKEMRCYETDASRLVGEARNVFSPKNAEEVRDIVKKQKNIVPRGGGTNIFGGTIPNGSYVIDLNSMNKVISFDRNKGVVDVEPGITAKELDEKLNMFGFEFPIKPMNASSTIGGMIAVNSFDHRVMKHGKMKEWIEEIEFVNGNGDMIKTSRVDVPDVCGMEGITGVIVRARIRVMKKIPRTISILQSENLGEVLSIIKRLKSEKEVCSLILFPKEVSKMLGLKDKYYLIAEFESDRGKIKDSEYEEVLGLNEKSFYRLLNEGYYNLEDHKFFFDELKETLSFLESRRTPYVGYLGAGVILSYFKDSEKEKREAYIKFIKKIGGKIAGFGFGIKRKGFLEEFEKKVAHRVKMRYDPFGKLNQGKLIDFDPKADPSKYLELLKKEEIKVLVATSGDEKSAEKVLQEIRKNESLTEEKKMHDRIEDYRQTFDSELPKEKAQRVEEIAKNIPKHIVEKEHLQDHDKDMTMPEKKEVKTGKRSSEEQDLINKIMFNRGKK
jgi:hypothetical protein